MPQKDLKKFRHDIAVLKRKGLITGVDARSVKPTPKLTKLVDRFDDVLSGKATPVKLSRTEIKNLKTAGYDVFKGRAIFPHSMGEKITVSHGRAVVRQPNGVERVQIPIPYHDLSSYLKSLKKHDKTLTAMKRKDEYFAFRFYGHQSHAIYRNIDLLIEDLERYEAVEDAKNSRRSKDMNEVYRNLEIVKVHRSRDWKEQAERIRTERGRYNPDAYAKAKAKRDRNPRKKKEHAEKRAAKMRDYRARIKQDPKKDKEYKAKAKKRAKKSRRKNAPKKNRRT